jgi:hypothetical protein
MLDVLSKLLEEKITGWQNEKLFFICLLLLEFESKIIIR